MSQYSLEHRWNGSPISDHADSPVKVTLTSTSARGGGAGLLVEAPFFDDPAPPGGRSGETYDRLWDYEVVEAFFLDRDRRRYLEVELSPHGQHLLLLLDGSRNTVESGLPLDDYTAQIDADSKRWTGRATIPYEYFPPNVHYFNLFAIHNAKDKADGFEGRAYECLFPVPGDGGPDFHRLRHFGELPNASDYLSGDGKGLSEVWRRALQQQKKQ